MQKREAEQDVVGRAQRGHQHIGQLVSNLEHLAQRLLAPTVNNVKHIASTVRTSGLAAARAALVFSGLGFVVLVCVCVGGGGGKGG